MKILLCALAAATLSLIPALAADPIYQADFERSMDQWKGRFGMTEWREPELAITSGSVNGKDQGILQVETAGRIGTGIELKPVIPLQEGKNYVLSYWLRTTEDLPVTFRVTDKSGEGLPGQKNAWTKAPESNGNWVQVSYEFEATASPVGVQIAAGVDNHNAAVIAISGFSVKELK